MRRQALMSPTTAPLPSPSSAPAGRRARTALAVLACAVLALGDIGLWRWLRPATPPPSIAAAGGAPTASGADAAGLSALRIRLLPEDGAGADPASVRIGIAEVAAQDAETWRAWVRGGMRGAGPRAYADMATVVRWVDAPAHRITDTGGDAGTVEVGPLRLPAADAYVLQAASEDRLRWYDARFTPDRIPESVRPQLASGLRVRVVAAAANASDGAGSASGRPSDTPRIALQFRRVEGSRDADWQPLLRRVAPDLLAAYDDTPLAVTAEARAGGESTIAPLPPGPVDAVVLVEGVEVMRRRLSLVPGQLAPLTVDADSLRRGTALATALRLRFVEAGSGRALRPVEVLWIAPEGERRLGAEADGSYRIARVDPAQPLHFDLRLAQPLPQGRADDETVDQTVDLPAWPERIPLTLRLDDEASDASVATPGIDTTRTVQAGVGPVEILRTVALEPLRWLVVDGLPAEARLRGGRSSAPATHAGTPPPVHVLQQAETTPAKSSPAGSDDRPPWRTVVAERFVARPSGVAVSIQSTGRYRLAVAVSPWRFLHSAAVDIADGRNAPREVRTGLAPPVRAPRTVRVQLLGASGPLARTPVQVLDTAGALPPWTLTTDAGGWLRFDAATEPSVRVEAPGHAQAVVPLRAAEVTQRLQPDGE